MSINTLGWWISFGWLAAGLKWAIEDWRRSWDK